MHDGHEGTEHMICWNPGQNQLWRIINDTHKTKMLLTEAHIDLPVGKHSLFMQVSEKNVLISISDKWIFTYFGFQCFI